MTSGLTPNQKVWGPNPLGSKRGGLARWPCKIAYLSWNIPKYHDIPSWNIATFSSWHITIGDNGLRQGRPNFGLLGYDWADFYCCNSIVWPGWKPTEAWTSAFCFEDFQSMIKLIRVKVSFGFHKSDKWPNF